MREKNNVIRQRDFEKYEVLLPFKAMAGKRKKQFLCSELEKMHPCFSDAFAYDSCFHGIKKGGLCQEVFVINKLKLAEYERKRNFSGSGFFMENKIKRRFFIDRKWLRMMWGISACLIVGLTGGLCGALAATSAASAAASASSESGHQITNEESGAGASDAALEGGEFSKVVVCPVEISFFESLSRSGGKITSFEWKSDGYTQRLNASVSGAFPESFSGSSKGPVIYESGKPRINLSYERHLTQNYSFIQQFDDNSDNSDFFKTMRETVLNSGGHLTEERSFPYQIIFSCGPDCIKGKLFARLAEKIALYNFTVTELHIKQSGIEELSLSLVAEKLPLPLMNTGLDLNLISQNLSLFDIKKADNKRPVLVQKEKENSSRQKIGEIKKSDKTSLVFYKNEKGKMEVEK